MPAFADSGHRLFLLDRNMVSPMTSENGPAEEFSVLGATANGNLDCQSAMSPLHLCQYYALT